MTTDHQRHVARRLRGSPLAIAAAGAAIAATFTLAPQPAFAFTAPLCANITCTGGAPLLKNSGAAASHAEVVPIFWGSYWIAGTTPSRGQVLGAVQHLLNGPYTASMSQYDSTNGVGPARMVPIAPISTASVPVNFATSDIRNQVNALIGQGAVPPPVSHATMLYTVFLPPGTGSSHFTGDAGYNTGGTCDTTCGGAYVGQTYRLLFIFPGANLARYGALFSHELTEAITQNISIGNCKRGDGSVANQISDLCECKSETQLNGTLSFEPYWSQADGECVIPEAWAAVWEYNGSPESWTQIAGSVRQIYAGGAGLVATDTNDNLLEYQGTPFSWSQIGSPGAMFAVGAGEILGLTPDTSAVWSYSGSTWSQIGGGASAVYAGAFDVATDYGGSPWQYVSSLATWVKLDGPADQIVVGDTWAAALDWQHDDVLLLGFGFNPILTNHSASELFAGGHAALVVRDLTATGDGSAITTSGSFTSLSLNPWRGMNNVGNMWAIHGTSPNQVVVLTPNRANVQADTAGIESPPPSWTTIGGAAGRLIGGGSHLYVTGGVQY